MDRQFGHPPCTDFLLPPIIQPPTPHLVVRSCLRSAGRWYGCPKIHLVPADSCRLISTAREIALNCIDFQWAPTGKHLEAIACRWLPRDPGVFWRLSCHSSSWDVLVLRVQNNYPRLMSCKDINIQKGSQREWSLKATMSVSQRGKNLLKREASGRFHSNNHPWAS